MRKMIVAALALSPLMVHAQSNMSAQPKAASAPVLVSSLMQPKALMLGAAEDRTTPKPGSLKVSTGVVAPKLTSTVPVAVAPAETGPAVLAGHRATVAMVVDTTGKPSSLSVVDSNDASLNTRFLDAVRQFRFKPGTVNGQPVAFPVNLVVTVK